MWQGQMDKVLEVHSSRYAAVKVCMSLSELVGSTLSFLMLLFLLLPSVLRCTFFFLSLGQGSGTARAADGCAPREDKKAGRDETGGKAR